MDGKIKGNVPIYDTKTKRGEGETKLNICKGTAVSCHVTTAIPNICSRHIIICILGSFSPTSKREPLFSSHGVNKNNYN